MSYHIPSYPKIHNLGSRYVLDIFKHSVRVQVKCDGSQFSFCKINGEYFCRSKGKDIILDAPEKLFTQAVEVIKTLDLKENWIYRAEYLQKPKHNTLTYNRIPKNHLIVYDIEVSDSKFLSYDELVKEIERIGLEPIKQIHEGMVENFDQFKSFLEMEDPLGGCKIEGLVIKSDILFTADGKAMMAKFVSENFREKHVSEWKKSNPKSVDILQSLISVYKTDARINKVIQHLKEDGLLTDSPKDIGLLIKEYQKDLQKEEQENIKEELFEYFWPKIARAVVGEIPEYYKNRLAESNFNKET